MAIRSDVTVEWRSSPRVITVPDPSTEITIQDLFDTLCFYESEQENLQWDRIVSAGGKESLGGGQSVGITLTLLNAQIVWGDRASPTVTRITGGNVVAVDVNGADIDVLQFSANVNCFIAQSSSATINDQTLEQETRYLVESLRENHYAWGSALYWDPVNGDDSNTGRLPTSPVLTFAQAKSLATAGAGDVIYGLVNSAGSVVTTERLVLDKKGLILRVQTGMMTLLCPDGADPAITISAEGVEVAGIQVAFQGSTPRTAVSITAAGGRSVLRNIQLTGGTGNGIVYDGGFGHQLHRCIVAGYTGTGIKMTNTQNCYFSYFIIAANGEYGLDMINSGAPATNKLNTFEKMVINANTLGGLRIGADVAYTVVSDDSAVVQHNAADAITDFGTATFIHSLGHVDEVWADPKALTLGKFIALK